jgi:hypothetical protein
MIQDALRPYIRRQPLIAVANRGTSYSSALRARLGYLIYDNADTDPELLAAEFTAENLPEILLFTSDVPAIVRADAYYYAQLYWRGSTQFASGGQGTVVALESPFVTNFYADFQSALGQAVAVTTSQNVQVQGYPIVLSNNRLDDYMTEPSSQITPVNWYMEVEAVCESGVISGRAPSVTFDGLSIDAVVPVILRESDLTATMHKLGYAEFVADNVRVLLWIVGIWRGQPASTALARSSRWHPTPPARGARKWPYIK